MKLEEYKKIITMAIGNEIAAYEFYTTVGKTVKDANLKAIFTEMAGEEKKHRAFLEGLLSNPKAMHFDESADYKVAESVEKPQLSIKMKPADAIALAMKEEEEAMVMYQALAASSKDPDQKKMFSSLALMEKGHKTRLEGMYTSMAFPEVW
jgi:rubrerythrin